MVWKIIVLSGGIYQRISELWSLAPNTLEGTDLPEGNYPLSYTTFNAKFYQDLNLMAEPQDARSLYRKTI